MLHFARGTQTFSLQSNSRSVHQHAPPPNNWSSPNKTPLLNGEPFEESPDRGAKSRSHPDLGRGGFFNFRRSPR